MSKFFVYVIRSSKDGRFYVGMTCNIENRLKEHNGRKTKSTKGYVPWELFFFEEYPSRQDARNREKYLKGGSGKEYIKDKWSRTCLPAGRAPL
ncbi:MAG: GIY-YIG nuclease family protein, partial [Bacteroidetes bacterium]|nr:GIY-YIG nuclease family protein [Bacteroidota bacterium]